MKNYYFNPKSQDLHIFDPVSKEMLVLERIEGIRVLTSSEIEHPVREEKEYHNHNWNPVTGKAKKHGKGSKPAKPAKKGGKWKCKNCGELGHSAKTCKNPQRPAPLPLPKELPNEEVQKIAAEERITQA